MIYLLELLLPPSQVLQELSQISHEEQKILSVQPLETANAI